MSRKLKIAIGMAVGFCLTALLGRYVLGPILFDHLMAEAQKPGANVVVTVTEKGTWGDWTETATLEPPLFATAAVERVTPTPAAASGSAAGYDIEYAITLTNFSRDPLRLPTAGYRLTTVTDRDHTTFTLAWDSAADERETGPATAETTLQPVALTSGQSVTIRWSGRRLDLTRLEKTQVRLRIAPAFAARHQLWSGERVVPGCDVSPVRAQLHAARGG